MDKRDDLIVRPAHSGDLDSVADVWFESASKMDGAVAEMPSPEELRSRIDQELNAGWDLHIALLHEKVVGMLALKPATSMLDQLFVRSSDQGRGVGQTLLNAAKRAMPGGFTLRTASSNVQGRAFYERQGLSLLKEGIHPRTGAPVAFYRWDAPERKG